MARKKVLTKEQKIEAEVKRLTHIFEKADKGYAVDLSENAVVFYIAE